MARSGRTSRATGVQGSDPGSPGVVVRRVYDLGPDDRGRRVLVDRLWPRGVAKADLALDEWCRDVAPSTGLRRWYGHEPDRFPTFSRRYRAELRRDPARAEVARLAELATTTPVLLLTATRDVERSGAEVLRRHLVEALDERRDR